MTEERAEYEPGSEEKPVEVGVRIGPFPYSQLASFHHMIDAVQTTQRNAPDFFEDGEQVRIVVKIERYV